MYRKPRGFNLDNVFRKMFYLSFIESVLTFSSICWFGSLSLKNKKRLEHVVKLCSKVAGIKLDDLPSWRQRSRIEGRKNSGDSTHPVFSECQLLT